MNVEQIMKLVDDYADATYASGKNSDVGSAIDADCVRVAVVAAIEQLTKDAARWKMLAEMEASMVLSETMRFYIANPDKLDYVIELKHNAYGPAIAAQKGEQV